MAQSSSAARPCTLLHPESTGSPPGPELTCPSPSFGRQLSEAGDEEASVHTNSTGDDGAADAAASAILDLEQIRKSQSMSGLQSPTPPRPARLDSCLADADVDDLEERVPTGEEDAATGPGTAPGSAPGSPSPGPDFSASRQLRRPSNSSAPRVSPRGSSPMQRAGTGLLGRPQQQSRGRTLSPSHRSRSVRSPPRRQASYRGGSQSSSSPQRQPDGIPSDCVPAGVAAPLILQPVEISADRPPDLPASTAAGGAAGEGGDDKTSPSRTRSTTVAAAAPPGAAKPASGAAVASG
eukprot:TRINITY_DN50092_c0_g1_i1.p2 TRINITY_DN50092_c0_g1~~TRINITY_DN50092_c0_g1_i1.p2  ORF type:complete len:294 (+),score=31.75 TRINITY_DN50092_c0_g1_i1:97-978(+)